MAPKTPISILQELVVSKREAPPNYVFESTGNLLNPEFSCTVTALSVTVTDSARNKKEAKQKAAARALEQIYKLGIVFNQLDEQDTSSPTTIASLENCNIEGFNYVGQLNEYASRNKSVPAIIYRDSVANQDHFDVICICGTKKTVGSGRNKKQAKQSAACAMLKVLKESQFDLSTGKVSEKFEDEEGINSMIINRFQELSTSGVIKNKKQKNFDPINIMEDMHSVEEAKDMLEKLDLNYHVETLQENPYLVVVQLENGAITSMGVGNNEDIATVNALNKTLNKIQTGCTLRE